MEHFDPAYLVTLDELYHSHWAAGKRRRIGFVRDAVAHFWPKGHPTRLIHITGTNGKGSTAHYLCQALRIAGNTGSWTGPHVFDYAERFHINNERVEHKEITEVYRRILQPYQTAFTDKHNGTSLSFAELGILLSLHLFERHNVAWAVMEVGAGGRYTPLTGTTPDACVLTNIGYDHPKTLGDAVWQRALEKAGIAKPDVPFFSAAEGDALHYVRTAAEAEGAAPFEAVTPEDEHLIRQLSAQALPRHQTRNLALAMRTARYFYPGATPADLLARMQTRLPGRFAHLADNILVDTAHNGDKVAALADHLRTHYPNRKFDFLLGLTRARDGRQTFAPLIPLARSITVTSASYAGREPQELADELRRDFAEVQVEANARNAYEKLKADLTNDRILVLTGSAYMIDQALNPNPYIQKTNATFGRRGYKPLA